MQMFIPILTVLSVTSSTTATNIARKSLLAQDTHQKVRLFVRAADASGGSQQPPDGDGNVYGGLFGSQTQQSPFDDNRDKQWTNPAHTVEKKVALDCHPKCHWTCGDADCDNNCKPMCAPPQCETACKPIVLASCEQLCAPPACAIVCPQQHRTEHTNWVTDKGKGKGPGACLTLCAPPKCHTSCSEQCESKCAAPQCTWKCNPGSCAKPKCSLTCKTPEGCGKFNGDINAKPPPFASDMHVVSKGLAVPDPSVLKNFESKPLDFGPTPCPGTKPGEMPTLTTVPAVNVDPNLSRLNPAPHIWSQINPRYNSGA